MQMMYEMDAAKTLDLETARKLAGEKLPGKNLKRSLQILTGIIEHLDEIDGSIKAHSRSWKTSRMPKVDLAIMRLALGEIKYGDDVPEAVAISEAIKLAKKYSTEQSSRFIHGVLGAIVNAPEAAGSAADADAGSAVQDSSYGYILGIDTSNYKTSIAVIDHKKHIICRSAQVSDRKTGRAGAAAI